MTEDLESLCERLAKPYQHPSAGVVVGVLTPSTQHVFAYGKTGVENPETEPADMLFEIGSITKVFTSILFAKLILEDRIDPDAPISTLSPELAGAPEWITPRSLATHTSGLPRIQVPTWRALFMKTENPYADFGVQDLMAWMARFRPRRRPKSRPRYSNLGMGLLGHLLAGIVGTDYETALADEVLRPLGLPDTVIQLDEHQRRRMMQPHKGRGQPTPPWDFDALAGAGALRSTVADLLAFAREVIDARRGVDPLHAAIARSLEVEIPGRLEFMPDQCLG